MIARSEESLSALESVDDTAMRQSNTQLDEFNYTWKTALTALRAGRDDAVELIGQAKGECERAVVAHKSAIARELPLFDVALALAQEDREAFNQTLYKALVAHKTYWKSKARATDGWIAMGPLAFACLAHDRGYPIEV